MTHEPGVGRSGPGHLATVGALLALLLGSHPAGAQAQSKPSLEELDFLSGCWAGTMGGVEVREVWTEGDGGVMLGTTRYFRDGVVVDWEFARIVEDEGGVTLWPYPRGEISEHGFPLVGTEGNEFVFENLAHDFPVRIIYVLEPDGSLRPRIEGHDGDGPGWFLERAC